MASFLTNYGVQFFAQVGVGQAITPPPFWYIALCDQSPNRGSVGSTLSEFTVAPSYARGTIQNDTLSWALSSYSTMYNSVNITFPIATEDWGYARYYALCDDLDSGNVVGYGNFGQAKLISSGDQAIVLPGTISFNVYVKPTGTI